jgi:hypothetical protein
LKYNAAIQKLVEEMPARMKALPISDEGYPVPWFVSKLDGKWNFVGIDPRKPMEAFRRSICWVCGGRLGTYKSFVIGPMCAVNRVTSEPASHLDCAQFSARSCPFLTRPRMRRNDKAMEGRRGPDRGIPIDRNPGVCLVWSCRDYTPFRNGAGYLFRLGDPVLTSWWAEGRKATQAEIMRSIETGMPLLQELADQEGPSAQAYLRKRYDEAMQWVPHDA